MILDVLLTRGSYQDVTKRLQSLTPSAKLLLFHMGTSDTERSSPRSIKDYKALGVVAGDSGTQVFFHQSSQSKGKGFERASQI